MATPIRIVSGGQTGVDRAALDWALDRGFPVGGWCPAGRLAEDGRIPSRYPLKETPESAYIVRTERNVYDSDATLLFSPTPDLVGGSAATVAFCTRAGHPLLHLARSETSVEAAAAELQRFLSTHDVGILNVAGPRSSEAPSIGNYVTAVLDRTFPTPFPP